MFSTLTQKKSLSKTDVASDGRHSRSIATRQRIVAGFIELIGEGKVSPTAEQVALRAGIGLRTVFRHFDDMETLYREVGNYVSMLIDQILQTQLQAPDWQGKLFESIQLRAPLYEKLMPFHIASHVHRHSSPYVEKYMQQLHMLECAILQIILPSSILKDKPRFEALVQALSNDAWVRLRREQKLSSEAAAKVMQTTAELLTCNTDK
jgi:AcrR family transcriptional regulator